MARRRNSTRDKNIFGAGCVVAGVLLLMWGRNAAYSAAGQLHYVFTGAPTEKAMTLMVSGGALVVIGMYQVFWRR
jgi:uncharacterized protein YjeT (DUF2065 family)